MKTLSVLIALFSSLCVGCGGKDGPAEPEDLALANSAYSAAKDLFNQQLAIPNVYFPPAAKRGHAYEDNIGFKFESDSITMWRIDSSAFVWGHYRLTDGTGGEFSVDMKTNGRGGWRILSDTTLVGVVP